ncbi:hypothetical protein IKS57_03915 [bacterium]|nr:hypothetical protein [bacterium]
MINKKIIEPSFLAFYKDPNLELLLKKLKKIGINRIHYDVMDNIYVPNYTFGTQYLNLLINHGFEIEVHFMVNDVIKYYLEFKEYKIDTIVFHPSVLDKQKIE